MHYSISKHFRLYMTTGEVANYTCNVLTVQIQHTSALVFFATKFSVYCLAAKLLGQ